MSPARLGASPSTTSSYFTGNTHTAASASYSDVSTAYGLCSPGDTLEVPSGSATWNSQLLITIGIKIIKTGTGTITNGYGGGYRSFLIYYNPSNPGANEPFRITGFTVDLNSAGSWLLLDNSSSTPITKIRVDHNTVLNAGSLRSFHIGSQDVSAPYYSGPGAGPVFGVADHNTFPGSLVFYGNNIPTWNTMSYTFGTADNMYLEDNVLTFNTDDNVGGGAGGRYCFRHNTGTISGPMFDAHGNQGPSSNMSFMGAEIYENDFTGTGQLIDHRGGKVLAYNNRTTGGSFSLQAREEYFDSDNLPAFGPTGQPQHVSESYYFHNTGNGTVDDIEVGAEHSPDSPGPGPGAYYCYYGAPLSRNVPLRDADVWSQVASFDGSHGIGYGLLSARPSGSAVGVGYWATDTSTLYRWNGSSWDTYYTPYTYPHPLIALM
jgi:hypothetical protein